MNKETFDMSSVKYVSKNGEMFSVALVKGYDALIGLSLVSAERLCFITRDSLKDFTPYDADKKVLAEPNGSSKKEDLTKGERHALDRVLARSVRLGLTVRPTYAMNMGLTTEIIEASLLSFNEICPLDFHKLWKLPKIGFQYDVWNIVKYVKANDLGGTRSYRPFCAKEA